MLRQAIFEKFAGREVSFTLRTIKAGEIRLSDDEYGSHSQHQPGHIDFEIFLWEI